MPYIGAPYNFVSLPKKITKRYENENILPAHNEIQPERLSGEFSYQITPVTDIFVGGYKESEFYKAVDGKFAIPGSTVRGLVRENMQILGFGSIGDDVDDYKLMYRKVGTSGKLANHYKNDILGIKTVIVGDGEKVTVCKNVSAGYIKNENGKYYIYKTVVDKISNSLGAMNYYPIKEPIIFRAVEGIAASSKQNPFKVLKNGSDTCLQHVGEISDFKKNTFVNKSGKEITQVKGKPNNRYVPYYFPVSYLLNGDRKISAVGEIGQYKHNGYVMSSGPMNMKKVLYIIPEINEGKEKIELSQADILSYKRDLEMKRKQLGAMSFKDEPDREDLKKKTENFFELPREGEMRPVFYIKINGNMYFGYTQYLRIFYKHTIKDGLPNAHGSTGNNALPVLDYAKSIMGYTTNAGSYKGRVYFSDARLNGEPHEKTVNKTLAEPKASSYWDYLVQDSKDGKEKTYEDDDFEIRGYKQYWLRDSIMDNTSDEVKVNSSFKALDKSSGIFEGKVHFENLTEDELGLLLWTLRLEENSQQNIGKAKAYGYGRVKIDIGELKILDYEQMYNSESFSLSPYKKDVQGVDYYISQYKDYISSVRGKNVMDELCIKELMLMKDATKLPNPSTIRYMNLETDYRNRRQALDTPEGVISRINAGQAVEESQDNSEGYVHGKIKMYDQKKGFGFVILEGEDVFFHVSKLQPNQLELCVKGTNVACKIGDGKEGKEVKKMRFLNQ